MFKKDQPGQMKYKVQDERYRDVYNERDRKRVTRDEPISARNNIIMACLAGGGLFIFEFILWMMVGGYIEQFFAMGNGKFIMPSTVDLIVSYIWPQSKLWWLISLGIPVGAGYGLFVAMEQNRRVQNIKTDTSHLNQYEGDSRLQQPEELAKKYDIFPDAGMHSNVDVTALLSHMMLSNKGLRKIEVVGRYPEDTEIEYDDGSTEIAHKDDPELDDNGEVEVKKLPMIDEKFAHELYNASGVPEKSGAQHFYNPGELIYNDNPDEHLGKDTYKTVAEKINHDWHLPEYELSRPGGMYIVDTDPNNTMVLAMTRAGKGNMARYVW